jgi:SHS2 domain-containing protein
MSYRFLTHAADVKFRADGVDLEEMFISSAEALSEIVRGDIKILEQEKRSFEVEGSDKMSLLYNFLEEFLVLLEKDDFLVASIERIEFDGDKLRCEVSGDRAENYKFTNDVKAVTYSEMFVREIEDGAGWECQVVLDV